jgi:hypothetical protein
VELRNSEQAQAWVAAGMSLSRLAPIEESAAIAAPWLIEAVSETGRLPPAGVVLDLGKLFGGHPLRQSTPLPSASPALRAALRSYEDHVLGRIEASGKLDDVIDAFVGLNDEHRARAVGVLTASLLRRLDVETVALSPGVLRSVIATPTAELMTVASEALAPGGDVLGQLEQGYRALTERAHRLGQLLTDADVFVVEHIAVLADLTQRLAIEEVLAASDELRSSLPRRIKARKRPQKKKVQTSLADEDHYPTGGFSSISTSGTLENLVISELIYMEEGEQEHVDLFDLRYAEGELLYYTRDDSQFVRDYRSVGFVLDANLTRARIKDPGAPRQRLIELLGMVHCVVGRLAEWLSDQALQIGLFFVDEDGFDRLASERLLLQVLFADEIERGLVTVARAPAVEEAFAMEFADPRADADWVYVGARQDHPALPVSGVNSLILEGPEPLLDTGAEITSASSWQRTILALLHRLV